MADSEAHLITLYRKAARYYDLAARGYELLSFRVNNYRRRAIAALDLHAGDTVIEIGWRRVELSACSTVYRSPGTPHRS